jgi:hypothetical protein
VRSERFDGNALRFDVEIVHDQHPVAAIFRIRAVEDQKVRVVDQQQMAVVEVGKGRKLLAQGDQLFEREKIRCSTVPL